MGVDEPLRFRYGLSFRGLISKRPRPQEGILERAIRSVGIGSATMDFRKQIARPVADDLRRTCGGDQDKVLYDEYYEAEFAGADLDKKLPPLYRLCELVIVFLCKDYADRDWCLDEWKVIQSIARAPRSSHRVMFLWHGPMDKDVMERLDLPRNKEGLPRDGFMHIDGKSWQQISDAIIKRYEKNKTDPLKTVDHVDISSDSWAGEGYRLQLMVQAPATCEDKPLSQRQFLLYGRLLSPEGGGISPGDGEGSNGSLSFSGLAEAIVRRAQIARIIVNSHARSATQPRMANARRTQLVVSLALPAELMISPCLYELLRGIRQYCRASESGFEGDPPPIALACAERIMARALIKGLGQSSLTDWIGPAERVQRISPFILGEGGANSPHLRVLNWWAYCDDWNNREIPPGLARPRHFPEDDGALRPGQALEETRLRPGYGEDDRYVPEALYLSWRESLPQRQSESFRRRMLNILYSGVPLFLIDQPGFAEAAKSVPVDYEDSTEPAHPFDTVLGWLHAELIHEFCRQHRITQPPSDKHKANLWRYLCNSLLFWEDDRCDYAPSGQSQDAMAASPTAVGATAVEATAVGDMVVPLTDSDHSLFS